jgi:Fic family protein
LVVEPEILSESGIDMSKSSLKRLLSDMILNNFLLVEGAARSTKYLISPHAQLFYPIDPIQYFEKDMETRKIKNQFDLDLIPEVLSNVNIFNEDELSKLNALQGNFLKNISNLSPTMYTKEMDRLAIDLSWKSSQIEGNTYSLLETERLLKDKLTAEGKTKDDAIMLLNHKDAIDFIVSNPDYVTPLSIKSIEDIHSLLIKELGVDRNIRVRRVGITGTNYTPLDNEYQIREMLFETCKLINKKTSPFEKSFLALILLSYIKPFVDGNKRTARITSNALLIAHKHCPLSYRTVDPYEYKKAMLIFYEQNNIQVIKKIFIDQYEFAVNTYF